MPLKPTELAVLATKTMRYTDSEAVEYLRSKKITITKAQYHTILNRIAADAKERLFEVAKCLRESHLNKLDTLRQIEEQYWDIYKNKKHVIKMVRTEISGTDKNGNPMTTKTAKPEHYDVELDPMDRVKILQALEDIQAFISQYEETTQAIVEETLRVFGQEEKADLSSLGI